MRIHPVFPILLVLTGCTAGPRASMFAPVSASPVELMPPVVDPFLDIPAVPESLQQLQTPPLPKLGPISSAARQQMWRAARTLGPNPNSVRSSIPLSRGKSSIPETSSATNSGKHVDARPTSSMSTDGQHGFVQIMPPPPDDVGGSAAAPRESRYFELPPAPER